jgi:hypothetical protein
VPRSNLIRPQPVEYFTLIEPRADGPVLGFFGDDPIPSAVVDCFGHRYVYSGLAPRLQNGRYNVIRLSPGEWIVEPGLVYRRTRSEPGGLLKLAIYLRSAVLGNKVEPHSN